MPWNNSPLILHWVPQLVPLFCELLLDSGTDTGLTRVDIMRQKEATTGGLSATTVIAPTVRGENGGYFVPDTDDGHVWLMIRGKSLATQVCHHTNCMFAHESQLGVTVG